VSAADDFRDWADSDFRLIDGRKMTAVALQGDAITLQEPGESPLQFDRKTGCAATGEQIDPADMYRISPQTYVRRARAKAAHAGYSAHGGPPFDVLPVPAKQRWMAAAEFVVSCIAHETPPPFTGSEDEVVQRVKAAPSPTTDDIEAARIRVGEIEKQMRALGDDRGWRWDSLDGQREEAQAELDQLIAGRSESLPTPSQRLPSVNEAIRILNALLELDRPGFSALMLTRHKVHEALADAPGVQAMQDGTLDAFGLLQAFYPALQDGRGAITAIVEGVDTIVRFEPTGERRSGPSTDRPVLPAPTPCLDPEKMNGFADQFPGTDDPSPDVWPQTT